MKIIICPGIHEPELTARLITEWLNPVADRAISQEAENILVFPGEGLLTLSAVHILEFLSDRLGNELKLPVIFVSFSAGVVGAIAAAVKWQQAGGDVKAFIAIDGWGMPLWGNFPIHRLSHDYFTHWSSALLGGGQNNFYAEPAVDHLTIWRSPQTVKGYWVDQSLGFSAPKNHLTAAEFLHLLVKHYEKN